MADGYRFSRSGDGPATLLLAALALIALQTGACREGAPEAGTAPAPSPVSPEPDAAGQKEGGADAEVPGAIHVVQEGETLWDISRAYKVSVNEIMRANGMSSRDVRRISKGAELKIPGTDAAVQVMTAAERAATQVELPPVDGGAYHFLRRGESVWTLARMYDVTAESIMERNSFTDDDLGLLRTGKPVIIPGVDKSKIKQAEPLKRSGFLHEVVRGETIWDISRGFQVSVAEIMAANALSADSVSLLKEGARLIIPGVTEDRGGRPRRNLSARERRASAVASRLGLGSRKAAGELLRGRAEARWMRAAGGTQRLEGILRWPVVKGWFVRGYGSGEDGYHLAVDIMGKMGWNVRAAARGIVAYSGNELRGYGNTVLVVHPGGWVTLYAHNSVNFVAAGEKVSRGAILAELGATGIAMGPHVHFEFIFNGKNCDPASLFRPGVQHRNGKLSRLKRVVWKLPRKRPEAIRCAPRRPHPRSRWVMDEALKASDEQQPVHGELQDGDPLPADDESFKQE